MSNVIYLTYYLNVIDRSTGEKVIEAKGNRNNLKNLIDFYNLTQQFYSEGYEVDTNINQIKYGNEE